MLGFVPISDDTLSSFGEDLEFLPFSFAYNLWVDVSPFLAISNSKIMVWKVQCEGTNVWDFDADIIECT